jgi:DNA-binding CsgD family transcriptional regulator
VPSLTGREHECEAIVQLLASVRDGLSAVLVLRGEPGIGKTALLDYAVESAADFDVARIAGIESEMELGFAGLHQLLLPYLARIEALPVPQREALNATFGIAAGPPPSRFVVTLAVLTLLAEVAAGRPLLCVVDDAQWIDEESTATLAAVARRLHADRIAMLIAVREPSARRVSVDRLPTMDITGLESEAARELVGAALDVNARGRGRITDRIVSESHGNPLGLLALAADATVDHLADRDPVMNPLPIGSRLEALYRLQARALPSPTQALLLTAAAEPTGDRELLWRAGEVLGFGHDDGYLAGVEELVDLGPPVTFRHPLMRSAVYSASTPRERSQVHTALAAVTDPITDPDRRAWHRAAAVLDRDEEVARELEEASTRARERGGLAGAAAFLARAAHLTPHTATRAERLVAAAQAQWMAGSDSNALRLVREAIPDITDPFTRARAQRLEAAVFASRRPWTESWLQVIDDARAIPGADVGFVRSTLLDAFAANIGHLEALQVLAQIGQTMPLPADATPMPSDLLLEGLCLIHGAGDAAAAAAMLRRSFADLDLAQASPIDAYTLLLCACMGAATIGDYQALYDMGARLENLGRELAAPVPVYIGLTAIAASEHGSGSLTSALRRWSLDGEVIRDYLPAEMFVGDVVALAWRGDEHGARAMAFAQTAWMADHNRVADRALLDWALAVLENGLGNYEAAFHHATQADPGASLVGDQVLLELVESAARSGRRNVAVGTIDRLAHRAQTSPGPLFAGFVARSRALVADDRTADDLYREAIELFRSADAPCHLARCHLVYGEWLRRQKRRMDAREQLREAHRSFVDMGAHGFAERTRNELAATGETVRKRNTETARDLTPQEERIARLAAGGDTNAEIASKMFLSAATIDYHLRKVFRKLDVTSRRDLRLVFPAAN